MATTNTKTKKKDYDLEHMPNFIKDAPWYMNNNQDDTQKGQKAELFHQRIEQDAKKKQGIDSWYKRGNVKKAQQRVTKFRKGACTNCGAVTHGLKECTERPRKIGAQYRERDIARDEHDLSSQNIATSFEGKRDRWNGYNPDNYKEQVIDEWNLKEELINEQKEKIKEQRKMEGGKQREEGDIYSSDSDGAGEKGENGNQGGTSFASADPKVKSGQHNLRIREDTAKYLRNLDPNSAPYDPKSRSMKANPNPHLPEQDQSFKGDNSVKISGDYVNLIQSEGFMLDFNKKAQEQGVSLNTLGMPSQFEILRKQFKAKQEMQKSSKMQSMMAKYGDQDEHLQMPLEIQEQLQEELDQQQMDMLESGMELRRKELEARKRDGQEDQDDGVAEARIVSRIPPQSEVRSVPTSSAQTGLTGAIRSKYESLDPTFRSGGHTSAWGSFWHPNFGWGYKCCQSFVKGVPCGDQKGREESIKKQQAQNDEQHFVLREPLLPVNTNANQPLTEILNVEDSIKQEQDSFPKDISAADIGKRTRPEDDSDYEEGRKKRQKQ